MYVFDNSPISRLHRSFYRSRFPTLWAQFDELIVDGTIISTREVRRELEQYSRIEDGWLRDNGYIFTTPTAAEAEFIAQIYRVEHFQQNIELKKIQKGGLNADPFVIAKAATEERTVVTLESEPPNGAKIPNICRHFDIPCIGLEEFMEVENWEF